MSNWRDPTEEDLGPQESTRGSILNRKTSRKQLLSQKNLSPNITPTLLLIALICLNIFLSFYLVIKIFTIGERLNFIQQQTYQISEELTSISQELIYVKKVMEKRVIEQK